MGEMFAFKTYTSKKSGIALGVIPKSNELMIDCSKENVLFVNPYRENEPLYPFLHSALTWEDSIFILDWDGYYYKNTADIRESKFYNDIVVIDPSLKYSQLKWNPLKEIRLKSEHELDDARFVADLICRSDIKKTFSKNEFSYFNDEFWIKSSITLITVLILHLLYAYDKKGLPTPTLSDLCRFVTMSSYSVDELLSNIKSFPHITVEEFLEVPFKDENDNICYDINGDMICHKNPLKDIYGEYIQDFKDFSDALGITVRSIDEIREVLQYKINQGETICWTEELDGLPSGQPFYKLLTHPIVHEHCITNLTSYRTSACIALNIKEYLSYFDNSDIVNFTMKGDFSCKDLFPISKKKSIYFVVDSSSNYALRNIYSLFIQFFLLKYFHYKNNNNDFSPMLCVFDNFTEITFLDYLNDFLLNSFSHNIKLGLSVKSLKQIFSKYREENNIIPLCGIQAYTKQNYLSVPSYVKDDFNGCLTDILSSDIRVFNPSDEVVTLKKLTKDNFDKFKMQFFEDGMNSVIPKSFLRILGKFS